MCFVPQYTWKSNDCIWDYIDIEGTRLVPKYRALEPNWLRSLHSKSSSIPVVVRHIFQLARPGLDSSEQQRKHVISVFAAVHVHLTVTQSINIKLERIYNVCIGLTHELTL